MDYGLHEQHASYILSQSNRDEEEANLDASWVMLSRTGEIEPLPHESILFKTRGRVALSITAPNQPTGVAPLSIKSESGNAYITNQRVGLAIRLRSYLQLMMNPVNILTGHPHGAVQVIFNEDPRLSRWSDALILGWAVVLGS